VEPSVKFSALYKSEQRSSFIKSSCDGKKEGKNNWERIALNVSLKVPPWNLFGVSG
jgi:hypothetical protein